MDDNTLTPVMCETNNYPQTYANKSKVEQKLIDGIADGCYKITDRKPNIVSALNVVPKPDGDIRLIHDCSQPEGKSVNDYASKDSFSYQTISDALQLIGKNWFMAKVDLQSAYRSVGLAALDQMYTGLQWKFEGDKTGCYIVDTRLPFGARKSPFIFNRITQSIKRMMKKRGIDAIVAYLDDFFVAGDTFQSCMKALNTLISLLRSLGFRINWKKVCDPSQTMTFLGVSINTSSGILSLDKKKLSDLREDIAEIQTKTRMTKRQLQSIAGKLSWASLVVPWGRAFIRNTFNLICTLKQATHKCRIASISADLKWWSSSLLLGSNAKVIWDERPIIDVYTDACEIGGGAFCHGDWAYLAWHVDAPSLQNEHINVKELASTIVGLCDGKNIGPENTFVYLQTIWWQRPL